MPMPKSINARPLKPLISSEEISKRVRELGGEITRDYEGKSPLLIGVLKGGFVFLADLVRHIELEVEIDFVRVASYGDKESPGQPELLLDVRVPVKDRDVILVEDLLDTGGTLEFVKEVIMLREPASFKICALVSKKERRVSELEPDYLGFEIERGFIVGYGTDWAERGRNLPAVYVLE